MDQKTQYCEDVFSLYRFMIFMVNSDCQLDKIKNCLGRGTGSREKVRSKRINLEGNTHAQEINVSQCPV
jgi:hypothetical protein